MTPCPICECGMCDDGAEHIRELEAQCAAMREALECIRNHHTYEDWRVAQEMADAALASDAGKAMLERLRNVNQPRVPNYDVFLGPCAHGREPYDRCDTCAELSPVQAAELAARAQAFEQAAQVAEKDAQDSVVATMAGQLYGTESAIKWHPGTRIAAAIRALAKEGT